MKRKLWTLHLLLLLACGIGACRKMLPANCEGEYLLKAGYYSSHPDQSLQIGDSLTIRVQVPFNVYNYASDSIVSIARFSDLRMGLNLYEFVRDTIAPIGFRAQNGKEKFRY